MPVEDIQYLKKHSVPDSHMVLIDSEKRDKTVNPTPSEFVIEFEEPFVNVFGIDVLDVTLSSTMYNIEATTNTLVYHVMWYNTIDATFFEDRLLGEIYAHDALSSVLNDKNTRILFATAVPEGLVRSDEKTGIVIAQRVEIDTNAFVGGIESTMIAGKTFYMTQEQKTVFDETLPSLATCVTITSSGIAVFYGMYYISPYEFFRVTQDGSNKDWCMCIVANMFIQLEPANYDLYGFVADLNTVMENNMNVVIPVDDNNTEEFSWAFPFMSTSDVPQFIKQNVRGDLTRTARVMLCASSNNIDCMIDYERSTLADTLGFSTLTSVSEDVIFKIIQKPSEEGRLLKAVKHNKDLWTVGAPGVIKLTGVRYILLRCPEVESHMFSSFAYGRFCPGIGLFKLSTNQETVQQRLDFVNFAKKPFHPIGRLKKITFRFELPNGALYDFRGVDIFMLMQVKYYAPHASIDIPSTLNPEYDPDYTRYMVRQLRERAAFLNGEDINDFNANDVLREQDRYDYSSEDEYGDEPYEEEINITRDRYAGA